MHNTQLSFNQNPFNKQIELDDQNLNKHKLFDTQNLKTFGTFSLSKASTLNSQNLLDNLKRSSYNDDEYISPISQFQNKHKAYKLKENLAFRSEAYIKKETSVERKITMVSVRTRDIILENGEILNPQYVRPGLDLLCLIDISGSMQGDKIELVKSTLNIFVNLLDQNDRLQLIVFNGNSERLTPLKALTQKNKEYFKVKINQIRAEGGTSISQATKIAFAQLEDRRYRNNVTSVFLLSDGCDNSKDAEQVIIKQIQNVKEEFTFHTFGFGNDHDYKLMTALSKQKDGKFYYLQNIGLLNQYFADAVGGLISVVGSNLEINIKCNPSHPYNKIRIAKTYGEMWNTIEENIQYSIKLAQISSGQQKDFVFLLLLPQIDFRILENQRLKNIIKASLKVTNPLTKDIIYKKAKLRLSFYNEEEIVADNEQDLQVAVQYQRVQTNKTIEKAIEACNQGQFQKAQQILTDKIVKFSENKAVTNLAPQNIFQLHQASLGSQNEAYKQYGQIQMNQMKFNNASQQGCTAYFDPQGRQVPNCFFNQNSTQQNLQNRACLTHNQPAQPKFSYPQAQNSLPNYNRINTQQNLKIPQFGLPFQLQKND